MPRAPTAPASWNGARLEIGEVAEEGCDGEAKPSGDQVRNWRIAEHARIGFLGDSLTKCGTPFAPNTPVKKSRITLCHMRISPRVPTRPPPHGRRHTCERIR